MTMRRRVRRETGLFHSPVPACEITVSFRDQSGSGSETGGRKDVRTRTSASLHAHDARILDVYSRWLKPIDSLTEQSHSVMAAARHRVSSLGRNLWRQT